VTEIKPLKILIGCDTFAPDVNGAAKFTVRLAAGLVNRGHEVVVVAPSPDTAWGTRRETHDGADMTVFRLRSWKWFNHPWLRFALPWEGFVNSARILDEVKPDVVHIQSHINVGYTLVRAARKRGIRVVATNHFMPDNAVQFVPVPNIVRNALAWVAWQIAAGTYRLVDAVTTPTRRAADYLEKNTHITDVQAISCGLNVSAYKPVIGVRTQPNAVFVGRLELEKHIDDFLRALASITDLGLTATIVGLGDDKPRLMKLSSSLGLDDRITYMGHVTDEVIVDTLSTATVFVMPSTAELQSIATMEAMASGLPVVAANAMALPHLVHDGENGYLFEARNWQELADKLRAVVTAPADQYEAFQRESLAIVQDHDIETTLQTFEGLYRG
jgi:glycosyltransferase involved in cell wall biosynthesis